MGNSQKTVSRTFSNDEEINKKRGIFMFHSVSKSKRKDNNKNNCVNDNQNVRYDTEGRDRNE